jgi:hypothetical protein
MLSVLTRGTLTWYAQRPDTWHTNMVCSASSHVALVSGTQVIFTSGQNQEDVVQLEQEIALLADLGHDNIVKYLGTERNNATNELSIFRE